MATSEMTLAFAWMYSTLSGDATLTGYVPGGINRAYAPVATTTPYVVMTYQSGSDGTVFGGGRAYADMLFQVVAVGPVKTISSLTSAAARIDTLLTLATQTAVTGGTILASFRTQPYESDVLVDGEQWTSIGGDYRLFVKGN